MADSTVKPKAKRPRKVQTLSFHKGRQYWYKTIGGRRKYYESLANDPTGQKSLEQWLATKDDPFAEQKRVQTNGCTLAALCDAFCEHKQSRVDSDELSKRMFDEYHETCKIILEAVDKHCVAENLSPQDFAKIRNALSKRYGLNGLSKRVGQVRSVFKYGYEASLLETPMRFGPSFEKPSAKQMREHRLAKGDQDFTAEEIRLMLSVANPTQRAMILLGCNGALGNSDIADLPKVAIDLDAGWLDYPRAKTATQRRIPLWPETVAAIRKAISLRPGENSEMLFVSIHGKDYTDPQRTGWRITGEFRQVLTKIKISDGRGFYGLRRTFQTQAEESGDLVAVQAIMGHIPSERDMSARYRQRISDTRLKEAVEVVRQWLLPIDTEEAK